MDKIGKLKKSASFKKIEMDGPLTNNINHSNKNNTPKLSAFIWAGINISIYQSLLSTKTISPRARNPCH